MIITKIAILKTEITVSAIEVFFCKYKNTINYPYVRHELGTGMYNFSQGSFIVHGRHFRVYSAKLFRLFLVGHM